MKTEKLLGLLDASREFAATLDMQRVLQIASDCLTDFSRSDSAAAYLLDGETLQLWATTPPLSSQLSLALRNVPLADQPHINKVITTGKPLFIQGIAKLDLSPAEQSITGQTGLCSILYLPLVSGEILTGVLIATATTERQALSEAEIDLCFMFANMAALAAGNARLYACSQHHVIELEEKISAYQQTEESQHEVLERLHKIASQIPGVVYQFRIRADGSACLPYASDGLRELFGVNPEDVREDASRVFARIPPKDYEGVMASIRLSAQDLSQWRYEFRVMQDDGTVRWLFGNAMPQRETDGSVLWHGFATDITEGKLLRDVALQENNFRKELINSLPGIFYMLDSSGHCLQWNRNLEQVLGCSHEEIAQSHVISFFDAEDYGLIEENIRKAFDEGDTSMEAELISKNGTRTPYFLSGKCIDYKGKPVLIGLGIDITGRKQMEDELRRSETKLRTLYETTGDAILLMDEKGFLDCNPAALKISGCATLEEFRLKTPSDLSPPKQPCGTDSTILANQHIATAMEKGSHYFEWLNLRADTGETFPAEILLDSMILDGKRVFQATIRDISERKKAEAQIRKMAHYDTLTALPNRTLLNDRVSQAISFAQRNQQNLAVLFVDLDHFKNINDTLGHRIGDGLLIEVAKRLKSEIRDEDTVSRLGGDEFILLLPDTGAEGAAHVADKILAAITQQYQIEQHELLVTPSIGIALYPGDGEDMETLLMSADAAMYRAKRDGRNNYRFFTAEMQVQTARKLQLGNALGRALERNQLHLQYQPQLSLENGRIIGAETLLRWRHPELGEVSPVEFIPIAEDSGMILPIGEWVLRSAVRQLKTWMDNGMAPIVMAVNLSVVQFRHSNLPELVSRILADEGVPSQYLELELTEGVAMDDPLSAINVMGKLHECGVRLAIDDFGTGYSSLSHLKRFQIYKLKIDRTFVRDITEDPEDKAIVAAVISMANSLGMQTLAEGVETAGQLEFLREKGCNEVQGYYFSKPLPADQFEAFVKEKSSI